MNGWGIFFLLLLLLIILPAIGWVVFVRWTAHRNGLPAPPMAAYNPFSKNRSSHQNATYPIAPRPSGVVGWVQDKFQGLKNRGTGLGGSGGGGGGQAARGQFRSLDPDGAWDDRVGHEADAYGQFEGGGYEEQELGLHPPGHYGGSGYGEGGGGSTVLPEYGQEVPERGRSRSRGDAPGYIGGGQRGLDRRYDEEMHGGGGGSASRANPFGDQAESSDLRGVSPRPAGDAEGAADHEHGGGAYSGKGGDSQSLKSERKSIFQEDMS